MRPLSKVLLPVDFSERSIGAARYARLLAGRCTCEVILLHVVVPVQFQLGPVEMAGITIPEVYRDQMKLIQRELDSFQAAQLAGVKSRTVVLEGDPATRIVETAHGEEAGAIVMPTHGYGPFRRFILGSNTAKVLHDADCPVWTGVHIAETPQQVPDLRHVLCAVDLGPQSAQALAWAAELRRLFDTRLTLLHVTAAVPEAGNHTEDALRANLRWGAEKEMRRLLATAGMEAELAVEVGEPANVICAAATRLEADVLVIGRGSASGVFGRLRTNAYAIIRQSPCPVVSV
jgi:nucleotide-binding universal stress UspA family protein